MSHTFYTNMFGQFVLWCWFDPLRNWFCPSVGLQTLMTLRQIWPAPLVNSCMATRMRAWPELFLQFGMKLSPKWQKLHDMNCSTLSCWHGTWSPETLLLSVRTECFQDPCLVGTSVARNSRSFLKKKASPLPWSLAPMDRWDVCRDCICICRHTQRSVVLQALNALLPRNDLSACCICKEKHSCFDMSIWSTWSQGMKPLPIADPFLGCSLCMCGKNSNMFLLWTIRRVGSFSVHVASLTLF